jgi:polyisoprenoid-binding protein YceI
MKSLRILLVLLVVPFVAFAQTGKAKKGKQETVQTPPPPPPAPPKAASWDVDGAHSYITFSVRHFFTPVPGSFDKFEGKIAFEADKLETSSVEFTVDVNSVNTKIGKRDDHLKSPDFFDAANYGTMKFVSESISKTGDNTFSMKGKMTIKGVTKDVEIPFTLLGQQDHPWKPGSLVAGLKTNFTVKRNDFGVGSGQWVETAVVGDDVTVEINLEVTRAK